VWETDKASFFLCYSFRPRTIEPDKSGSRGFDHCTQSAFFSDADHFAIPRAARVVRRSRWFIIRLVMDDRNDIASKAAMAAVALVAWLGLGIQFYVTQTHPNLQSVSVLERTLRFFEYFTILTNLLVAVSLTIALLAPRTALGRFFSRTSVKTAIAVYISVVGIVYNIILQGLNEFTGAALAADTLTHDVVPVFYAFYWLLFVPKGGLPWSSPVAWTIYPLLYLAYALIRGSSTGRYPYPFLDVGSLGLSAVLINSMVLTAVFFALGEAFVGANKMIARFKGPVTNVQ
jgi:hypothetical protein